MAKHVFSNLPDVAAAWAAQNTSHGRNDRSTLWFRDDTIYSYGRHFPIATIIHPPHGPAFVAITDQRYSVSTSRHISYVHRAARHAGHRVIEVPGRPDTFADDMNSPQVHDTNAIVLKLRSRYDGLIAKGNRARLEYKKEYWYREAELVAGDIWFIGDAYDLPESQRAASWTGATPRPVAAAATA